MSLNPVDAPEMAVPPSSSFYITGGTLPPEASSYVTRQADEDLRNALLAGEYCYVLNSRQMGKSSLCVRAMGRLRQAGVRTVFVDLTKLGGSNLSAEQWYAGMLSVMGRELGLRNEFLAYWKTQAAQGVGPLPRLFGALEEIALPASDTPLVVFVDEIDATRSLPFSADEFFSAIRQLYVERAVNPALKRLAFCLLGTAAPSDLIQDTRISPFNIGRRVEVTDFTAKEAAPLAKGLNQGEHGEHGAKLLQRALYWTNGHPYLTQRLCSAIVEAVIQNPKSKIQNQDVDKLCADLFLTHTAKESDNNLTFVRDRLLKGDAEPAAVLDLYAQARDGKRVADDDTNPLCGALKLSGIARVENGLLRVRNRIYAQVFDRKWIANHTSDAELRRQQTAYRRGVHRTLALAGVILAVFSGVLAYAFRQRNDARHNARLADEKSQLADNKTLEAKRAFDDADYNLYVANMNLIQRDWDNGNIAHAQELLETTRQRGQGTFEWGYWNRLCHLELLTLKGSSGNIHSVAFSPDGARIATGGTDGTVRVWEAATGHCRHVLRCFPEHVMGDSVDKVVFSPNGSRLLAASVWHGVKLWDTAMGVELKALRVGANNDFAAFSPDGTRILTTNQQGALVRDIVTGRNLLFIKGPMFRGGLYRCRATFSPDGRRFVTAGQDQTTRVWDAATGKALLTIRGNISHQEAAVAFSPDGRHIVTGMDNHTVQIWDARTGKAEGTLTGHTGEVSDIAFSPDGKRIATGGADGQAKIWDRQTARCLITLKGHSGDVSSVAFSRDGKCLITCGDKAVKVWDATAEQMDLTLSKPALTAGFGGVVSFSPDGRRIAAVTKTGGTVWDAATGKALFTRKAPLAKSYPIGISSDGSHVLAVREDKSSAVMVWKWVWNAGTGIQQRAMRHTKYPLAVFSPDGTRIALIEDSVMTVLDTATGKELLTFHSPLSTFKSSIFSQDNSYIATENSDGTASVWDLKTGKEQKTFGVQGDSTEAVAFSPDGARIATGSMHLAAKIWDRASGRCLLTLKGHGAGVFSVAFSGDGKRLVTGSADNTAKVWDAATGADLLTLKGHTDSIHSVAFSPDGKRVVTRDYNGIAKVWFADDTRLSEP